MRKFIKYTIVGIFILFFSGCGSAKYIYIQPEYPILSSPRQVPEIKGAYLRAECLWFNDHNTNLCKNDLKVVLTQIEKLRENEKTCQKKLASYNDFVAKKIRKDSAKYKLPKI